MTDQFEHAAATIRALPPERRDAVARVMPALSDAPAAYPFPPDEAADLDAAEAAAAASDLVPNETEPGPPANPAAWLDRYVSPPAPLPLHLAGPAVRQRDRWVAELAGRDPAAADALRERFRRMLRILPVHPTTGLGTRRPHTWRVVLAPCPYALTYRVAGGAILVLGLHPVAPPPAAAAAEA